MLNKSDVVEAYEILFGNFEVTKENREDRGPVTDVTNTSGNLLWRPCGQVCPHNKAGREYS